jgi:hypothetical protein
VLFTFPSRYLFTIGRQAYLALEGGPPSFPQDFSCPVVLRYRLRVHADFAYGAVTLFSRPFQAARLSDGLVTLLLPALQPRRWLDLRFGLFPVRSPLLGESLLISVPAGTEMFQFPAFASLDLCIQSRDNQV